MTEIPLVDLRAGIAARAEELQAVVDRVVESAAFVGGPDHDALADELAAFMGGGHVVLCGNGTDALELALMGLCGAGDGEGEIIAPSFTFIATAEAITRTGWRPVFVDVDPATLVVTPERIAAAITPRTRAIVPVHLYGQMADMEAISALAETHGLTVIEDAAQAHGATFAGHPPGHWSSAACYSFYPAKNLGAWGDGGAVFTRDGDLAERLRMAGNHGRASKYVHQFEGRNSRLDGLQAAILRVKLRHLAADNRARRRWASRYDAALDGVPGIERVACDGRAEHVRHLYVVRVAERDSVRQILSEAGIGSGLHYSLGLHEQPAYAHLGYAPEDLAITYEASRRVLSLPMYPELSEAKVDRIVGSLRRALA